MRATFSQGGSPVTDSAAVRDLCGRALSYHRRRSVRHILDALARSPHAALPADVYGQGEAIAALEAEIAGLLGKAAAMFVAKGVVAQQAALRAWSDRSGRKTVALHPRSHIDRDEGGGYERLHGLRGVRIGADHAPFTAAELAAVAEPLGAVVVELPLRRAGYLLPAWEELAAIAAWCRARAVPLHLDGARLWEAQPFFTRPLAEIAALADSVYVSFYKGLGGLGGAMLAGPADFIAEARVWQARQSGAAVTAFPWVISAAEGLRTHLPRMPEYCARARTLAEALNGARARVSPDPPQCNAFQLHLPAAPAALAAAHLALAREAGAWLFGHFAQASVPGWSATEIVVGDAADDFADAEVAALVARLLTMAGAI